MADKEQIFLVRVDYSQTDQSKVAVKGAATKEEAVAFMQERTNCMRCYAEGTIGIVDMNEPAKTSEAPKPPKNKVEATVQFGLFGYVLEEMDFEAESIDVLIFKVNERIAFLKAELTRAEEEDGDLRRYCPQNADGYPSMGTDFIEPEFGEEFDGCLLEITIDGKELEYNTTGHAKIRRDIGLH